MDYTDKFSYTFLRRSHDNKMKTSSFIVTPCCPGISHRYVVCNTLNFKECRHFSQPPLPSKLHLNTPHPFPIPSSRPQEQQSDKGSSYHNAPRSTYPPNLTAGSTWAALHPQRQRRFRRRSATAHLLKQTHRLFLQAILGAPVVRQEGWG